MISHRWITSLARGLRSLARCRRGGFAMIYTLAAIPVFLAVGVAVDAARGYLMQTRLSNAIDAAALAAGSFSGTNNRDLSELAWEYFRSNYGINATFTESTYSYTGSEDTLPYASEITSPDGSVTLNIRLQDLPNQANVIISARTDLPTTFMRLASINEMEVAAGVEVMRGQQGMELVMVLDNTGSMQGSSITNLRLAARGLVNALYTDNFDTTNRFDTALRNEGEDTIDTLRIGVVPYTATVNIGRGYYRTWDESDGRWETQILNDSTGLFTETAEPADPSSDDDSYINWLRPVPALTLDPDGPSNPEPADSPEIQRVLGTDTMPFHPDDYFTEAPHTIREWRDGNHGYYELECLNSVELTDILEAVLDEDDPHDLSESELFDVREQIMDRINSNSLRQNMDNARTLTDARVVDLSDCALYSDTIFPHATEDPITLLPPPGPRVSESEPIYIPYAPRPYVDGSGILQLDDMPVAPANGDPRGWLGCVMARRNGLDLSDIPPVLDFDGDGHVLMPSGGIDVDDLIEYGTRTEIDTDLDGLPNSGSGLTSDDITALGASVTDTLFTPYRWVNEHTGEYDTSHSNNTNRYNVWPIGGLDDGNSSDPLYWGRQARRNDGVGPNLGCPPPILPLSNNYTEIMNAVGNMGAWHRGGTYSNLGMVWGMRVLSPRWRSFWNLRDDTGAPDQFENVQFPLEQSHPDMMKVVIIMTDGDNNAFQDDFTSFGYLRDVRSDAERGEHHGLLTGDPNPVIEANNRTEALCRQMRGTDPGMGINTPNTATDDNVIIYTVVLGTGDRVARSQATFDRCASAPEFSYTAAGPNQLSDVFRQISDSLTSLRLTN